MARLKEQGAATEVAEKQEPTEAVEAKAFKGVRRTDVLDGITLDNLKPFTTPEDLPASVYTLRERISEAGRKVITKHLVSVAEPRGLLEVQPDSGKVLVLIKWRDVSGTNQKPIYRLRPMGANAIKEDIATFEKLKAKGFPVVYARKAS